MESPLKPVRFSVCFVTIPFGRRAGSYLKSCYLHEHLDSVLDIVETIIGRHAVCNEVRRVC